MFELTVKQKRALSAMRTGRSVFITGQAGTGKSAILKEFMKSADKDRVAVTSTTGVSAVAIGGRTLHSWAGVQLAEEDAFYLYKKIRSKREKRERWLSVRTLIIDEVSMLSADLFEKLEKIARLIRRSDAPFGGIQLVLTGDFCQLPIINAERFCFESEKWDACIGTTVYLEEILRQGDPVFCKMLQELRMGICTEETAEILESRVGPPPAAINGTEPTRVLSKNDPVNRINRRRFQALLKGGAIELKYKTMFDVTKCLVKPKQLAVMKEFLKETYRDVTLAVGAQVMLTWNLNPKVGLANGSLGVITEIIDGMPKVRFVNGVETVVGRFSVPYEVDNVKMMIDFMPLRLAWAYTIHKSQGATLDFVVTDIGEDSIWEYGQAYVVLSRVRSLDALYLEDFDRIIFRCHPRVKEFYKKLEQGEN